MWETGVESQPVDPVCFRKCGAGVLSEELVWYPQSGDKLKAIVALVMKAGEKRPLGNFSIVLFSCWIWWFGSVTIQQCDHTLCFEILVLIYWTFHMFCPQCALSKRKTWTRILDFHLNRFFVCLYVSWVEITNFHMELFADNADSFTTLYFVSVFYLEYINIFVLLAICISIVNAIPLISCWQLKLQTSLWISGVLVVSLV